MNADLLCPDIVQLLTWATRYPAEVEAGLSTVDSPEVLFSDESTVTALAGLLARAPIADVCRAVRCRETGMRVRWVAAMADAEATRRTRAGEPPEDPPTPDEVSACVTRAIRWQADACDYAADATEAGHPVADAVRFGALVRRREDLERLVSR
jgi:hypothetical protein